MLFISNVTQTGRLSRPKFNNLVIGHSRLITNSTPDNQPILIDDLVCIHNGIITNFKSLFLKYKIDQKLEIDSEILPALINYYLEKNYDLNEAIYKILEECEGIINCAIGFFHANAIGANRFPWFGYPVRILKRPRPLRGLFAM